MAATIVPTTEAVKRGRSGDARRKHDLTVDDAFVELRLAAGGDVDAPEAGAAHRVDRLAVARPGEGGLVFAEVDEAAKAVAVLVDEVDVLREAVGRDENGVGGKAGEGPGGAWRLQ